jgi:hypothetical protein
MAELNQQVIPMIAEMDGAAALNGGAHREHRLLPLVELCSLFVCYSRFGC